MEISTYILIFTLLGCAGPVWSCHPDMYAGKKRKPDRTKPLQEYEYVPKVSETHKKASGKPTGAIRRSDPAFWSLLVRNDNQDIVFKDEENNGDDRLMTKALDILSSLVIERWPKPVRIGRDKFVRVQLRVFEAWDDDKTTSDGGHARKSLHYEGRAVDITTYPPDRNKLGELGRLAVNAGFDWVYYESPYHMHVSVKEDSEDDIPELLCFPGSEKVTKSDGSDVDMRSLQIGDEILSMNHKGGLEFSPVIAFIHRETEGNRKFTKITTADGNHLCVSLRHLVFKRGIDNGIVATSAQNINIGSSILSPLDGVFNNTVVTNVSSCYGDGIYAPLTRTGSLVVSNIAASCYAHTSHSLGQAMAWPIRMQHSLLGVSKEDDIITDGIHTYFNILLSLDKLFGGFLSNIY